MSVSDPFSDSPELQELRGAVASRLVAADEVMVLIVSAVAGLLATIAYSDRDHSEAETQHIKTQLNRIEGLSDSGVDAILDVLQKHIVAYSSNFVPRFARVLTEHASHDMRVEVLDVALGVAAADGTITHDEIQNLRTLTNLLGLSQNDYTVLQTKYREHLHFSP